MTLTLELPLRLAEAYLAEAQARGLPLEELVSEVLSARFSSVSADLSPEEWVREFKAWTQSHAGRGLPLLADEDISRESIYAERGL